MRGSAYIVCPRVVHNSNPLALPDLLDIVPDRFLPNQHGHLACHHLIVGVAAELAGDDVLNPGFGSGFNELVLQFMGCAKADADDEGLVVFESGDEEGVVVVGTLGDGQGGGEGGVRVGAGNCGDGGSVGVGKERGEDRAANVAGSLRSDVSEVYSRGGERDSWVCVGR